MKHQFFMCFLLAICASSIALAQEPTLKERHVEKPLLFEQLPSKQNCDTGELENLFHSKKFQKVSLKLNDDLLLSGEILENLTNSAGVQNINIRLSNFNNALLHLSIFPQPHRLNKIIGRIIHPKHGDALIISEENGKYYITKHKMELFMVE